MFFFNINIITVYKFEFSETQIQRTLENNILQFDLLKPFDSNLLQEFDGVIEGVLRGSKFVAKTNGRYSCIVNVQHELLKVLRRGKVIQSLPSFKSDPQQ